jgi:hypothetical protein
LHIFNFSISLFIYPLKNYFALHVAAIYVAWMAQAMWRHPTGWTVQVSNPYGGVIFRIDTDRP